MREIQKERQNSERFCALRRENRDTLMKHKEVKAMRYNFNSISSNYSCLANISRNNNKLHNERKQCIK